MGRGKHVTSRPDRLSLWAVGSLPVERQELARGMLSEAALLQPGPERRRWLLGAGWFIVRGGFMSWLRWAAISGSALFVLWIVYNGIDSGFRATPVEFVSYLGLIAVLLLNIVVLFRGRQRLH